MAHQSGASSAVLDLARLPRHRATMFPFRDHNPSRRTPIVTYVLLAANILVFLAYVSLFSEQRALGSFFGTYGMVPARLTAGDGLETLFTSMFLHGGFMHIAGNMLFLYIFGDNLEDEMGPVAFLGFYLFGGLAAGLAQYAVDPFSQIPVVGASGAIAAVMGGYLLMFPKAGVDVLLIIVVFFKVFTIPAWTMLAVWFGLQLVNGVTNWGVGAGVAYWAHAGGFIVGFVLVVPLWLKRGGTAFWARTHGHPDKPEAQYKLSRSSVPRVPRR